jgi:hypothetical protein
MAATRFLLSVCLFLGSFSLVRGQANPVFGVYRELWTNLNQSVGGLAALTNTAYNPSWPNSPVATYTKVYTNFETEANTGMNYYGQRLRTFVVPPASGNYIFWISSDDNSQLFVSSDENPANMAQVAWVSTWTNPREWTKEPNQQSAPLPLQAGCRYYVEARMQQGGGGDNLAVRWQMPNGSYEEPLTAASAAGTRMVPCVTGITAPGIFVQPSNTTVVEGQNATFSVLLTNQCLVGYQWVFNGNTLVAGARAAACRRPWHGQERRGHAHRDSRHRAPRGGAGLQRRHNQCAGHLLQTGRGRQRHEPGQLRIHQWPSYQRRRPGCG